MHIVGITGTVGAGKGTVVEYMVKNMGFRHYSVREFLMEELKKRGLELNRDNMRDVANLLRKEYGADYIVQRLYYDANQNGTDAIIESIRCVGEIDALRTAGKLFLLGVDADQKIRYERIRQRGSSTDDVTFEQFTEQEKKEMHSDSPYAQNLSECLKLADKIITNDGSFEELYKKLEDVFDKVGE